MLMLILKQQYLRSNAGLYLLGLTDKTSQKNNTRKSAIISNLGTREFQRHCYQSASLPRCIFSFSDDLHASISFFYVLLQENAMDTQGLHRH